MNTKLILFIIFICSGYTWAAEPPRLSMTLSGPARLISSPFDVGDILGRSVSQRSASAPVKGESRAECKSPETPASLSKLKATAPSFKPIFGLPDKAAFIMMDRDARQERYNPSTIEGLEPVVFLMDAQQLKEHINDVVTQFPREDRVLYYRDLAALLLAQEHRMSGRKDWFTLEAMIKNLITKSFKIAGKYSYKTSIIVNCLEKKLSNNPQAAQWRQFIIEEQRKYKTPHN
ncbi:MAG TPA: hypothetical protein VFF04_02085 [Candidatus Babeliales bacterium]|nr:hypothetical protein [Candidatus Babeliales bacterium]